MKVLYTGIGSNESGEHSLQEFLNIMYSQFTNRYWTENEREYYYSIPQLTFKRFKLPEEFIYFTVQDWLEYSGASVVYTGNNNICKECGKRLIVQNGECVNCEYIRFINTYSQEVFQPLDYFQEYPEYPEYPEYTDSCEEY